MSDKMPDAPLTWRKSSYSGNDTDKTDCVEVAFDPNGAGAFVRDSKDPAGGAFTLPATGWRGFLASVSKVQVSPAE
ncbi:DUF397 domain-containing protein [Amycolatopsis sp. NPDC051373]|uniref:DUF397 domain-containing protein n=1 Tax=Amycolatopsis sp. NPDC051373 TaxID=3155801 RepID=UPI00344D38DA